MAVITKALSLIKFSDAVVVDSDLVKTSENQTIEGVKTFGSSPIVPTIASAVDNSGKAASTGWVTSKLAAWWNAIKGAAVTFGSTVTATGGFVGNLDGNVTGEVSGNAATATKLSTSRSLNVKDADETNTGTAASFDGSGNATIKLPSTIKASITGHASQDALDSSVVHNSGNETIAGTKTFSSSPLVPTVLSPSDSSTKAASTGWVTSKLAAWWNAIKGAAVTFGSTVTATGGFVGNLTGHASQDAIDSSVVHKSGLETITGEKNFTGPIYYTRSSESNGSTFSTYFEGTSRGQNPTNAKSVELRLCDGDNNPVTDIVQGFSTNGYRTCTFRAYTSNGSPVDIVRFSSSATGDAVYATGSALAAAGMPSGSYDDIIIPSSSSTFYSVNYTPDVNGYVCIKLGKSGVSVPSGKYAVISDSGMQHYTSFGSETYKTLCVPVKKGRQIYIGYSKNGSDEQGAETGTNLLDYARIYKAFAEAV